MDQAEPGDTNHDQIDRDDVVEQLRHDEDQNSGEQRHDRLDVGNGQHGYGLLEAFRESTALQETNYAKSAAALPLNDFAHDLVQAGPVR